MQKYKCISIKRDKNGIILAYLLQDTKGAQRLVPKHSLKAAIKEGKAEVVNLTLTSDDRLVEKEYKPQQANKDSRLEKLKALTDKLNTYRDAYYNKGKPLISDYEYDALFDELSALEKELGVSLPNSPTKTVGYPVVSKLNKVRHTHPMLSLDKTKNPQDLLSFVGNKPCLLMHKLDGLTITLRYVAGRLKSAVTRGNGEVGEDVTHNARFFGIPSVINYKEELIIDGEAIIDYPTFDRINAKLRAAGTPEDKLYKTPRNLASGSVRQLNSAVAAQRNIRFICWKVYSGIGSDSFADRLEFARKLGFSVVQYRLIHGNPDISTLNQCIESLKTAATNEKLPIDGLVISYNSVSYGESLGMTGHHVKSQLAFKFYDEEKLTTIRNIEFSMGKTGVLTPVAVFDPVIIDGTEVTRASLHNLSILQSLKIGIGDQVTVYKANQIIPQIRDNLTKSGSLKIPVICPTCGAVLEQEFNNNTLTLVCHNPDCAGKKLKSFAFFASKNGMDIQDLSESTLERLLSQGWLHSLSDLYSLSEHRDEMIALPGMGEGSVDKLLFNIEKTKTNELSKFITALSIPLIGRKAGKQISKEVGGTIQGFIDHLAQHKPFVHIADFGETMEAAIYNWATPENLAELEKFNTILTPIVPVSQPIANKAVTGLTFVITGSLNNYKNRDELKDILEGMGAKVSGSVTSKTNYLINNNVSSASSKNKKAKELGVPIISEADLEAMLNK